MKYDVKGWLIQASKEDLIAAATNHSVSTGITNPFQLRRMLLDKFDWSTNSNSEEQNAAWFLAVCLAKRSVCSEEETLGWVVTRELEHGVMVAMNEHFQWTGLDLLVSAAKAKAKSHERAQQALARGREVRMGESLVDEHAPTEKVIGAQTGPRMVQVESHVCGGDLSINIHRDDGTSYQIKGEDLEAWNAGRFVQATVSRRQGDGEPAPFTPVEPNPESLDDLSLEDLLGHYATLKNAAREVSEEVRKLHDAGDYSSSFRLAGRVITAACDADNVLEHIERRFEKQGWLISRIKDR